MRVFLIVLDSVGIGQAPDAADYGDSGSNTLAHTAAAVGGLSLPVLQRWGLGCIPALIPGGKTIQGVPPVPSPAASYGAMRERSKGKDTTTGHWEIAGLWLKDGFHVFPPGPPSFPVPLLDDFIRQTGRPIIGNRAASGTRIIEERGTEHMQTGAWIVYTSADSVFQIAAHESVIPLDTLYAGCAIARRLCDPYRVGRVIARPFTGNPGTFKRTTNRRDFSFPLPGPTILDRLKESGREVITIGKLDDIFAGQGITRSIHSETSKDAIAATLDCARKTAEGLVFVNLIDFDMRFGHRRDPSGYAGALVEADRFLGQLASGCQPGDCIMVTADHGNDPTFTGTDHTREWVPLLVYTPRRTGQSLGLRNGFFDIAQTLAQRFGLSPMPFGTAWQT
ncbi:MAG: phosphopentomutase [Lentisphaerae bacterium RIFOXYC12_FULL_60_16]|nr:MAG: phosphopentomutase [Lentisphaerae bacterium RIFOXYC12_FULL_60_16]OGV86618.1 MAG: phosphopentomutase [Lentisphaerae bacterium RIFOXYB12_FULL_60_10]